MQENINRNVLLLDDLAVNNLTPFAERGLVRDELAVDKQLELDAFAPLVDPILINPVFADRALVERALGDSALADRLRVERELANRELADRLRADRELAARELVADELATNELAADEIATSELIAQEALDGRVGSFINAEGLLLPGHLRMQLNEKLLEEARARQALALKERDILTNEVLINDIDGVDQINGEII
ncbi:MAG: hypothetical protein Terrestrivirus1_278 [Terrestrivirus sp.]|uniref:Uncharacterized protein n=1 Tax=Terrestrivirus sp. TaxID=2487775 RepID=A0A3G4ZLW4_9VIRU|nr:MAG: hypothetical protein Terrestrivirus1_278 [Terrestrivirus sp.]